MKTNTLSFRIFLFTSIWMLASLIVVAILVLQDYRRTVESQFEELITANLYNLMGSVSRQQDGSLQGNPELGDTRYQQFRSGWYWSVHSVENLDSKMISTSLAGEDIPVAGNVEFNNDFQRSFRAQDRDENDILVVEAQVYLGEGDNIYTFRATGNLLVLDQEINSFSRRLILFLAISGVGLVIASLAIVRFGLRPIDSATGQLSEIRNGNKDKIEGAYPQEIAPLIDETNALIRSNQAIVERSRTQVGNLAHSLKTPLSVLSLEVENLEKSQKSKMRSQLESMKTQIQTYLNRAMISARHGSLTSRTDAFETVSRFLKTFNKLFPEISFELEHKRSAQTSGKSRPHMMFAGEEQDLEEVIGNILENAGKFAKDKVLVTLDRVKQDNAEWIEISILDDGPGLTPEEIDYVMKRGNRLDENKPGTGLGLSIVSDILKEYGGAMRIESNEGEGLSVNIHIPAAN